MDGDVKVFNLTIDEIEPADRRAQAAGRRARLQQAVARARPSGSNQGDKVRAVFTNNLKETTGVHFHGVEFDDFFQDGVPFVTQKPIVPGETYAYEFTANNAGLADVPLAPQRDRPGRPRAARRVHRRAEGRPGRRTTASTSGSRTTSLGGFTINGHGFPAAVPVLAAVGETVRIRFMNEGIMMHPWHSHGYADAGRRARRLPARVSAAFTVRHPGRQPGRALGRHHRPPTGPASGRSTATSCRTSRARAGCSGWSTR